MLAFFTSHRSPLSERLEQATRFHYQHPIYLPRPQSLAIVLGVFKLNYQAKRDKGGNRKGRKKKQMVYLPIFH